jgi:hypothetical protein
MLKTKILTNLFVILSFIAAFIGFYLTATLA